MNLKKSNKYLIFIYIILIALIAYLIFLYNQMLNNHVSNNAISKVHHIHANLDRSIEVTISDSISALSLFSKYASDAHVDYDTALDFFNTQSAANTFDELYYIDTQGNGIALDGSKHDFSQNALFIDALSSEFKITSLYQKADTSDIAFDVAMPIITNGSVTGIFISTTCAKTFYENIYVSLSMDGFAFITNDNFDVIFSTEPDALGVTNLTASDLSIFTDEYIEQFRADFATDSSGTISYTLDGVAKILAYAPIDMTEWTLFVTINKSSASDGLTNTITTVMVVSGFIFLLLILLSIYTSYSRLKLIQKADNNAYIDPLTKLPNLVKLKKDMKAVLSKNKDTPHTLIKFDITNFKAINEMYGFEIGNKVLKSFYELSHGNAKTSLQLRQTTEIASNVIIARTGVDEFMIFSTSQTLSQMEDNIGSFSKYCKLFIPELKNHKISFKYGRYYIDLRETDVDEIVNKVNLAHKLAKETKGVIIYDYDDSFKQRIRFETEITNKMRLALENCEYQMYLQPKFDVANSEIVGAEALVRWIEQDGNIIYPDQFIPIFEKTGFIINLDNAILESACKTIRKWIDTGVGHLPISVNYSRMSFNSPNFIQNLCEIVDSHNVPHEYIEVELTESTIMDNEDLLEQLFIEIHKLGFKVSIDDFGSGYSSLGLLKNLKIDTLKLDRSFFTNSKDVVRGDLVIDGIVRLAQSLNIYVVAEGIETIEQLDFLKLVSCDATQGYYFSKPIPVHEFEEKYADIFNKHELKSHAENEIHQFGLASEDQKFNFVLTILNAIKLPANMFNYSFSKIKCNKDALNMFNVSNNDHWNSSFFDFSPEFQPDGSNSKELARELVNQASEQGYVKFNWIHYNSKYEEIPCEIIMSKLHVLDDNGEELFLAIIHDKRGELAVFSDEEDNLREGFFFNKITDKTLLNVVTSISSEWFFSYDIINSSVQFFGVSNKGLKIKDERYEFPNNEFINTIIYPEDLEIFNSFARSIKNGIEKTFEIRLMQLNGTVAYHRFAYKTIKSAEGNPIFTVGKAININEQKTLESMATKDLLTDCYNKISTENLIKKALTENPNSQHALFVVDIDDFKSINDNLGHSFGDSVLKDIASTLHNCFRDGDIIGRIGGDEFVIFLKNIKKLKITNKKANMIVEAFKNNYTGETGTYKVSGSVGISLYPQNASDFESLYTSADKALYQSKMNGKDCYTFYSDELFDGTMSNLTLLENVGRIADAYFDADFISNVFELLYEMQNSDTSIEMVLKFIGMHLKVDRCFIMESMDEGKTYSKTYEWCNVGHTSQKENFQNMPAEHLSEFLEMLNTNDAFYCNDFTTLKSTTARNIVKAAGVESMLLLHTSDKQLSYIPIIIGFVDCEFPRIWTEKEINSAKYILKMISIFVLVSRQNEKTDDEQTKQLPPN